MYTLAVKPKAGYMVLHNNLKTKVVRMSSPAAVRGFFQSAGAPTRAWDHQMANVQAFAMAAAGVQQQ